MQKKLLTISEVAIYLGWSRATIYNKIKDKTFPVKPVANTWPKMWNVEDIDAWRFDTDAE